jgi:hypothetical protein
VWAKDIKSFSRAYDLICIVDQIHNFAITKHRQFVIDHLEPWLCRAEEIERSQAIERLPWQDEREAAEFSSLFDESDSEIGNLKLMPTPEWAKLKEATQAARNAKSLQTRDRNFLLRAQMGMAKTSAQAAIAEETTRTKKSKGLYKTAKRTKQGRGRPSKVGFNSPLRRSLRLSKQGNSKV